MGLKEILEDRKGLLKIRFNLPGADELGIDLLSELIFTEDVLGEHIETQAGMMAWWGTVLRKKEEEIAELELQYDVWMATVAEVEHNRIWAQVGNSKSNRPTGAAVTNAIKANHTEEYVGWNRKIRTIQTEVNILKDCQKWWLEKGMMLVQAAKLATTEMEMTGFQPKKPKRVHKPMTTNVRGERNDPGKTTKSKRSRSGWRKNDAKID